MYAFLKLLYDINEFASNVAEFALIIILLSVLALMIVSPIFAFMAFKRVRDLATELSALKSEVAGLRPAAQGPPVPPAEAVIGEADAVPDEHEPEHETQVESARILRTPTPANRVQDIEQLLTSNWLVWGGSVALAIGGVFLVRFSIEQGLLGPKIRVGLGLALGVLLVIAGEFLRRRPLERALAAIRPSYIPPALTAAGISILFTSIYATYALYDLISVGTAFLFLAGVAACAVLLSLTQGPLIAVIGLVGGFLIPWLTSTGEHRPEVLFPYLLLLTTGSLAIVRHTARWWLAWLALAGATIWPMLWFAAVWQTGDAYIVGSYLLVVGALFMLMRFRVSLGTSVSAPTHVFDWKALTAPDRIAVAAALLVGMLIFALVRMDHYGVASLVVAGVGVSGMLAAARRESAFDALCIAAAILVLAIVAFWHLPEVLNKSSPILVFEGPRVGGMAGPIVPPTLAPFLGVAAVYALIVGAGGFYALWGARRPVLWSAVSAATPVLVFAIAYWRIEGFALDLSWTGAALVLAAILLFAAERVQRFREARGMTGVLGAYAACVIAALSLAATTALGQAWLTVALAVQLPAIAWIAARLDLPAMRWVAFAIGAIVLVRLGVNYHVLDYPIGGVPGLNWLIYGYGGPAVAFFLAARMFRRRSDDIFVTMLEAGALVFSVLFVSLEIRHLMSGGPLDATRYDFSERTIQSLAWLTAAYALYVGRPADRRLVPYWGWRILAGLALGQVMLLQVLFDNPWITGVPVGSWPIFNLLLIAYLVPAGFAVLFLKAARRRGDPQVARVAGIVAVLLGFVWVNFEIRHAFHGTTLAGAIGDAELYAYSLGWLAYAGILLALALALKQGAALRYASLALVILAAGKAVFFDMSALTGIWRALSFIGVGLAAVAVSYLYRSFVFPPRPQGAGDESLPVNGLERSK